MLYLHDGAGQLHNTAQCIQSVYFIYELKT